MFPRQLKRTALEVTRVGLGLAAVGRPAYITLGRATAPAYGDLELGRKHDLPTLFSVDLTGHVVRELDHFGFGRQFFKDADPLVIRYLDQNGYLFAAERISHAYPFCWRCSTPLLQYAKPAWYVRTTARKDRLLANNESINWIPPPLKAGRFGTWLGDNVDWALSRERYWGTPLPIWICETCDTTDVVGSVGDLGHLSNRDLTHLDLHRPRYVIAAESGLLVALNTVITPALRLEGRARDLIRAIQSGRKRLNLSIADRLQVIIQDDPDLDARSLIESHGAYIRRETLANSLIVGEPEPTPSNFDHFSTR